MGKITKVLLMLFVTIFFCISNIYAGETGKLAGKVIDKETGEPLIGANIVVVSKLIEGKEIKLDFMLGAATDIDGEYYILGLAPGYYNVKASYIGFTEEIRTQVEVNIDKTTKVDFQLSAKTFATDEVMVVGFSRDKAESDLTATRQTYDISRIESMPGITNIGDVISLQADVSDGHFRGGRSGESLYLIGGSSIVNPLNNSRSFEPMTLAFQQVEVFTSGFSAEYGNVQSGVINMVTKEGQNKWETRMDVSSTNSYYKTWGGSVYSLRNNYFYELMKNPETWLDGKDPASGKILWTHFGINFPENYLPKVPIKWPPLPPLSRKDSLRTANLVRAMWLESFKQLGLNYDKPDYKTDFSISGPLAQNAAFFLAGRYEVVNPILPSTDPDIQTQILSSLVYRPFENDKFKMTINYNKQTTNEFGSGFFGYFDPVFNLTLNTSTTSQVGLEWYHIFNQSTFWETKIGILTTDDDDRINLLGGDEYSTIYNDNSNWRFYTDPSGHTIGSLNTTTGYSKTKSYSINSAITSQIDKYNMLKSGLQFFYYDMEVNRRMSATNVSSVRLDDYHVYPFEGALYLQDKMEFEGMIANVGLRYDFYNFNTQYYLDKFSPYRNPNFNPKEPGSKYYSKELAAKEDTKFTSALQPRIGISFPVDDQTVLHLNYGIFTQRPAFEYVYVSRYKITPEPNFTRLGNPELKPEKTISYDVGIVRALPFGFNLDLSAYLKDVSNLVQDALYIDKSGNLYQTFNNREYADIKGFHVNLEKNYGNLTGFVRYNWQAVTGKASSAIGAVSSVVYYESDPASDILPAPEDIHLDYDRTHRVLVNLSYKTGDGFEFFGINPFADASFSITYRFQTGRPFTYDASGQGLRNNLRTPDEHDVKLRIDKAVKFGIVDLQFYLEGFNLFNTKTYNYSRTFSDSPDNQYRTIYVQDQENLTTERQFAPYVTNIESYLMGNQPRHFRFGVNLRF